MKDILFLDDNPNRAAEFLRQNSSVLWVTTSAECIAALHAQNWSEIHLDHDLGGEVYVESGRADCGMEVVRYMERLQCSPTAEVIVHSWNSPAAIEMVTRLRRVGYNAMYRPFGIPVEEDRDSVVDAMCDPGCVAVDGVPVVL